MARLSKAGLLNKRVIITSIIAGFLLLIVNTAVWANREIFNEKNFTSTTVNSLTSQSSRDAIAGKIIDESLKDYPRLQNLADDSLTKLISGLLDGERVQTIITKSVSRLHVYLTSSHQKDVIINLEGIKDTIGKLAEISGRDASGGQLQERVQNMPDQIILIDQRNIPDFYKYGVLLSFLAPIALLLALIFMAVPYVKDRANYLSTLLVQGVVIIIVGILAALIGPLFRPVALSSVSDPNGRVIVENLYNSFIASFNAQNLFVISIGLIMCLSVPIILYLSLYRQKRK